tara:strand:- start:74 stop:223 length:150 start_codon:yes stop_codon:yes gene_type:complete
MAFKHRKPANIPFAGFYILILCQCAVLKQLAGDTMVRNEGTKLAYDESN